jgi:EmrB/QacA subfamily drug resistance transporter
MFALAMNWSIVNTAIPAIQNDLKASLTTMQWLVNAFGLGMVPFLVSLSRLSDLYGRKLYYVTATLLFGLVSYFAAITSSLAWLIVCRGAQGLCAAIILPISQVLLTKEFDEDKKGAAIGIWMAAAGIGCGLGPFIGGALIQFFSWRWIFYVNIPFSLLSFVLCLIFTKESKDPEHTPSMDIWGNLLLITFLACFILATVQGPDWGWGSPVVLTLYAIFVVSLILFYFLEKHCKSPIIDFSLYKTNSFITSSMVVFYVIFFLWSTFFLLPLYLQNVADFDPFIAGLTLLIISVPFAIMSPVVGALQKVCSAKTLILVGLFGLTGFAVLALFFESQACWSLIIISFLLFGLGWAFAFGPSITAALSSFPSNKIGLAAGSINTSQEIGGSVGLAILGSLFRSRDKSYVFEKLEALDSTFLHEHLVAINSRMSDPKSLTKYLSNLVPQKQDEIKTIFYDGFLQGFHDSMLTLAILGALLFIVIALFMHKKKNALMN